MNHKAIANKIEDLRIKHKISDSRWQEMQGYILPDHQGDPNHLLLLLNIYAMFAEMNMNGNQQKAKAYEFLGIRPLSIWSLSNANAKILQRSLLPEYQSHLREKRAEKLIKASNRKYELYIVASGENIGFDDLKSAIDRGYFYDGMNGNLKVLAVDGEAYRIFLNGVMFEPVDLKEWR